MTAAAGTPPKFGLSGFIAALAALIIVGLQISGTFDPPQQSAGATIGEIAAEIRQSARAALSGEERPAPPTDTGLSMTQILTVAGTVLGALGAVVGAIGLFRQEPYPLSAMAIGFGVGAILMQYLFWMAMLICGAMVLVAIVNNIGDIFG